MFATKVGERQYPFENSQRVWKSEMAQSRREIGGNAIVWHTVLSASYFQRAALPV